GARVAEVGLKQARAHHDAARARFEAGVSPRFDVIRAEVEVAKAEEELTLAEKGADLARRFLNNLLGLPLDAQMRLVKPPPSAPPAMDLEECEETALNERVEIRQIELGIRQSEIGKRISRQLPSFGLQVSFGIVSEGSAFTLEEAWSATVMGEIPLYDSGGARGRTGKARAAGMKLEVAKARVTEGIRLQVEEAYLNLEETVKRLRTSEAIVKQAEEAVKMAEIGYKEGLNPHIDLVDAQQGLNAARMNAAKAWYDHETAKSRLMLAMGLEEAR
ncbi:MAG: TolC family protein, partial [bacterium]